MFDEDRLKKWFALEGASLNEGLVRSPRPLTEVLSMEEPALPTKGGGEHTFERTVLEELADALSPMVRGLLKVPILFYVHHDDQGDCHLRDRHAIQALDQLGAVETTPREGKLWMALPLAQEIARRWPTVFQFVRY